MGPALMSGHWRYGGRMEQIYESIAQGRPNGMPSWQFVLGPTQIWDLAAYVKSLSAPAPASASQTAAPRHERQAMKWRWRFCVSYRQRPC